MQKKRNVTPKAYKFSYKFNNQTQKIDIILHISLYMYNQSIDVVKVGLFSMCILCRIMTGNLSLFLFLLPFLLIYSKNAELIFKICTEQEDKSISLLNLFENNNLKRFDKSEISRCVTIWYSGSFNFDAVLFLVYFFEQKKKLDTGTILLNQQCLRNKSLIFLVLPTFESL